ncbi:unnamed protein product, partial [Ectocarpus sp. 8 AP-2014]
NYARTRLHRVLGLRNGERALDGVNARNQRPTTKFAGGGWRRETHQRRDGGTVTLVNRRPPRDLVELQISAFSQASLLVPPPSCCPLAGCPSLPLRLPLPSFLPPSMWTPTWLALGSLCLVAAHVADAKFHGRTAWLPSLRLIFKHSETALTGFLSEIATRSFNHDHVGITAVQPPLCAPSSTLVVPKGFRVNARRQLLGTGSKVYDRAVRVGLRERGIVNRLQWASMEVAEQGNITSALAGQESNVNRGRDFQPFSRYLSLLCGWGGAVALCFRTPRVMCFTEPGMLAAGGATRGSPAETR